MSEEFGNRRIYQSSSCSFFLHCGKLSHHPWQSCMYSRLVISFCDFNWHMKVLQPENSSGPDYMLFSDGVLICVANKTSLGENKSAVDVMNNLHVTAIENWYSCRLKNTEDKILLQESCFETKMKVMTNLLSLQKNKKFHTLIRVHIVFPSSRCYCGCILLSLLEINMLFDRTSVKSDKENCVGSERIPRVSRNCSGHRFVPNRVLWDIFC
jgi:hypothetical protein